MKAILLAAGRGSRMDEGTAQIPKCMMKLCGRTLLDRCLDSLLAAGFGRSDVGIVTGYQSEKIDVVEMRYFHNADWQSTNMFASLTKAKEWLQSEPCIVSYSDIAFHPSAAQKLMEDGSELAITYYTGYWELWSKRFEHPFDDLETFRLDGENLIEIGGKPAAREDIQGQYMGLLRFTPESWEKVERAIQLPMPKPVERLDMTTLLQHLLTLGVKVRAIRTDELWLECDTLNDIRLYEKEYAELLQTLDSSPAR